MSRRRRLAFVFSFWLSVCLGASPVRAVQANDGPAQEGPASPPTEVAPDARERARARLDALAERWREARMVRAEYVQERTSPLLVEPLVSRGTLTFRTEPACLVFEVREPDPARLRMDAASVLIHRPDQKSAERFTFAGAHPGRALLEAFRPEADALFARFFLVAFEEDESTARLELVPRDPAAREHVHSVTLRIDRTRQAIAGIAYDEGGGHTVALRLSGVVADPELEHADVFFSASLPTGTRLLEHRIDADGKRSGG